MKFLRPNELTEWVKNDRCGVYTNMYTHCITSVYRSRQATVLFQKIFLCIISRCYLCINYSEKNVLQDTGYKLWGGVVLRKYWTEKKNRSNIEWFIVCTDIRTKVRCIHYRLLDKIQMSMTSCENEKLQTHNFSSPTYFHHHQHLMFSTSNIWFCTGRRNFSLLFLKANISRDISKEHIK